MAEIVENFLDNNGFNETDIAVYLDVFKFGQSFASSIALRTQIDRTTVYSSLKRLLNRGVIAQTKVNDVRAYIPISPEVFADRVDMEMDELVAKKKAATTFAGELKKLKKGSFSQPKIRIFEGDEAIINLYEETLVSGGTQKAFLTLKSIPPVVDEYLKNGFMKSKKRKKVFSKVIVADSKAARGYAALDCKSNRETKIVAKRPFNLYSEIVLFGDRRVAIIDFHQQIYGMVIESRTLYKTMETMFDFIWGA